MSTRGFYHPDVSPFIHISLIRLSYFQKMFNLLIGCGEGDRQDEAGRGDAGPDAAGGPAHEARAAPTRGKSSNNRMGQKVVPRLR